jgi:hypothetical protein
MKDEGGRMNQTGPLPHPSSFLLPPSEEDIVMNYDEEAPSAGRGKTLIIIAWVVGAAASLLVLVILTLRLSSTKPPEGPTKGTAERSETPWASARSALLKVGSPTATGEGQPGSSRDLSLCKEALEQLNAHLAQLSGQPVPELPAAEVKRLRQRFNLSEGEWAEVSSTRFTPLDAHHLDAALLLRDAARSLELRQVAGPGGKMVKPAPLEQARAAFAWVVRQVRLPGDQDSSRKVTGEQARAVVPPAFVLRRGWGTALERALVFLALLEQFGTEGKPDALQGCLLFVGDRLWACGVVIADRPDLYLFDPFLGLPLPGPGGKGIATLKQAHGDSKVLKQLSAGDKQEYDVKAKEVRKELRPRFVCPLSALSPRMVVLQKHLLRALEEEVADASAPGGKVRVRLPAPVVVRVAEDVPGAMKRLAGAVKAAGLEKAEVDVWQEGTGALRNFLPPTEGGSDPGQFFQLARRKFPRMEIYKFELVVWSGFPERFRHSEIPGPLVDRLRNYYAAPFIRSVIDSGAPRDLLLRGNFNKAARLLVDEGERLRDLNQRKNAETNLEQNVDEWIPVAIRAHAEKERAKNAGNAERQEQAARQVEAVWRTAAAIHIYIGGAQVRPYGGQVAYWLALCKYEQAERLQARLDFARRVKGPAPTAAEVENARQGWVEAESQWDGYVANNDKGPGSVAGRRLRGEALVRLGNWQEAVKVWRELVGPMTAQEKLANLYRARELEKLHAEE